MTRRVTNFVGILSKGQGCTVVAMLSKDNHCIKLGCNIPYETSISTEPRYVSFVTTIEEYRSAWLPEGAVDKVSLAKSSFISKIEMIQLKQIAVKCETKNGGAFGAASYPP
jgi:hypothetical protein